MTSEEKQERLVVISEILDAHFEATQASQSGAPHNASDRMDCCVVRELLHEQHNLLLELDTRERK